MYLQVPKFPFKFEWQLYIFRYFARPLSVQAHYHSILQCEYTCLLKVGVWSACQTLAKPLWCLLMIRVFPITHLSRQRVWYFCSQVSTGTYMCSSFAGKVLMLVGCQSWRYVNVLCNQVTIGKQETMKMRKAYDVWVVWGCATVVHGTLWDSTSVASCLLIKLQRSGS